MEALNAFGSLSPLSVLAKRKEPRKHLSLATISQFKTQSSPILTKNPNAVSNTLKGVFVLVSSVLTSELSKALTYDEALSQSISETQDLDVAGALDGLVSFAGENPLVIGGAAAVIAVPLLVAQLIGKPNKPWGTESAKSAYAKLSEDSNAELLDIRSTAEIKEFGRPDIGGLKKKAVAIVYKGEDKPGFLKKLALKFKEPENTTLFILDKFDGNSELVAELVTANGFKAAYAIKDGAEGPRGWTNSGLPWIAPKKTLSLDLSNFTDAIGGALGEANDAASVTIAVAAAAGLGLLAFTEVETILQVLGSAAIIQFVSKKLLFAEDRKQTIQQVEEVLNTKVAPKELIGDIQQIGMALLPVSTTSKALPAPAEAAPAEVNSAVEKSEPVLETNNVPPKVEAVVEPTPIPTPTPTVEINSVPKAEVKEESLPAVSRPLSPYPNYPDFKPPTSPMPSRP